MNRSWTHDRQSVKSLGNTASRAYNIIGALVKWYHTRLSISGQGFDSPMLRHLYKNLPLGVSLLNGDKFRCLFFKNMTQVYAVHASTKSHVGFYNVILEMRLQRGAKRRIQLKAG